MKKESIFSRNVNLTKMLMLNLELMSNLKKSTCRQVIVNAAGDWQLPSFLLVYYEFHTLRSDAFLDLPGIPEVKLRRWQQFCLRGTRHSYPFSVLARISLYLVRP